jgi:hypothetical protein
MNGVEDRRVDQAVICEQSPGACGHLPHVVVLVQPDVDVDAMGLARPDHHRASGEHCQDAPHLRAERVVQPRVVVEDVADVEVRIVRQDPVVVLLALLIGPELLEVQVEDDVVRPALAKLRR